MADNKGNKAKMRQSTRHKGKYAAYALRLIQKKARRARRRTKRAEEIAAGLRTPSPASQRLRRKYANRKLRKNGLMARVA
jgi:hypothetical protein